MPSKLGPHILSGTDSARRMIGAGCRIVKMISGFDHLKDIVDPDVFVIGRQHTDLTAGEQFSSGMKPDDAARYFIAQQIAIYRQFPRVNAWEGHNEPVWENAEQMEENAKKMAWYAEFDIERLRILAESGMRGVIGNFATGNPGDMELWRAYIPAIKEAKRLNGVLGLHEYSSPWMWWMSGKYQMDSKEDEGDEGWVTLRYRKLMHKYLKPEGCDDVLIAITECGLDRIGHTPPQFPAGNWKDNIENWKRHDGTGDPIDYWRGAERDPNRYYAEQLMWYDRELRKDTNVIGATIFTVGHVSPWENYDIAGTKVVDYLVDYISRESSVEDVRPPVVVVDSPKEKPLETKLEIKRAWGVDTSAHKVDLQGNPPKWGLVKDAGASFVIGKVSGAYSDTLQPFVDKIWKQTEQPVRDVGMVLGGFHYWQPLADPIAQAECFRLNFHIRQGDMPPIVDIEEEAGIAESVSLENLIRFIFEVEKLFKMKPLIYTGLSYWTSLERRYSSLTGLPLLLKYQLTPKWASSYDLWMSFPTDDFNTLDPTITVPSTWMIDKKPQWRLWQTSWEGRVSGIQGGEGDVDMNWYNGSIADLRAWVGAPDSGVVVPILTPPSSFKHQVMINAFAKVFGAQFYWSKIESAGLAYLAADRQAAYQGPSVYDLPNLTDQEKNVLVAILAKMDVDVSAWKAAQIKTALLPTNQAMINTFEMTFGGSYWDKVEAANLTNMKGDRYAAYAGPAIYALPNLSDQDKEQLIASLKEQGFNASLWQTPQAAVPPSITNQAMIEAFNQTFGANIYWSKITSARLENLAASPEARQAAYSGPAIDDLPGLSKEDKEALTATFVSWGIDVSAWKKPAPKTHPDVTNQQLINVFSEVFGEAFWSKVEAASLGWIAKDRATRNSIYSGPAIEDLPTLTDDEKKAIIDELNKKLSNKTYYSWKYHALPGLHGPGDPGGGWVDEAYSVVRQTKVRAVKMLAPDLKPDEVSQLRAINPDMFITARLFSAQLGERRTYHGETASPESTARWFANEVADRGDSSNPMNRACRESNLEYFEVHNEPNLRYEGCEVNWRDGAEFARFFNTVVDTLKQDYPKAKFGFPGMSPGAVDGGRPIDMWTFLDQAQAAVDRADFLCCHFYWGGDGTGYEVAINNLRKFCERYPHKLVFCSEFSNTSPHESPERKADQYAAFYAACKDLPPNLGAMFVYALSWRRDEGNEGFLRWEDGWKPTPMASRLGGHSF